MYKKHLLIIFGLSLFIFSSCWKYEDGGSLSVYTKTQRVAQAWNYDKVFRNGLLITDGYDSSSINYANSSIGFNDEGRFSYNYVLLSDSTDLTGDGNWQLIDNDDFLELTYDTPFDSTVTKFKILRLERKELWLEQTIGAEDIMEYQLVRE